MSPSIAPRSEPHQTIDHHSRQLVNAILQISEAILQSNDRDVSVRRQEFAAQLMSLGNVAAGALLFGQAFSGFPFDGQIAFIGLAAIFGLYGFALYLMKGGR